MGWQVRGQGESPPSSEARAEPPASAGTSVIGFTHGIDRQA